MKKELSNITLNTERPLTAANAYSNIVEGVNAAKELADLSSQAANNATELVSPNALVNPIPFWTLDQKLNHLRTFEYFRVRALIYALVNLTRIHGNFWEKQERRSILSKRICSRTETMHSKPLNKSKS